MRAATTILAVLAVSPCLRADLFVDSYKNNEMVDCAPGGALQRVLSNPNLVAPTGIAVAPDGTVYVVDSAKNEIVKFDGKTGAYGGVFASGAALANATDLTIGPDKNLYLATAKGIERVDGGTGALMGLFTTGRSLNNASGITFGPDRNLYVSDRGSNQVLEFSGKSGAFTKVFAQGNGLNTPVGATFGPDGNLYVANTGADQVLAFNGSTGAFLRVEAAGNGLNLPIGVKFGPDGVLHFSNNGSNQILKFSEAGVFQGIFESGSPLSGPAYVAFTPAPEPGTMALVGGVLVSLGVLRSKRRVK